MEELKFWPLFIVLGIRLEPIRLDLITIFKLIHKIFNDIKMEHACRDSLDEEGCFRSFTIEKVYQFFRVTRIKHMKSANSHNSKSNPVNSQIRPIIKRQRHRARDSAIVEPNTIRDAA